MRLRRLLPLALLVLAVLGAVGYGIGIAWPAWYARRVLAFERNMKQGPQPSTSLADRLSRNDPVATRELLEVQQAFVDRVATGARGLSGQHHHSIGVSSGISSRASNFSV